MKLPALVLAVSLAANAAFFVAFSFRPALAPLALRDFFGQDDAKRISIASPASSNTSAAITSKTPAAEPPASLWSQFDSADLPTLIAHLRAAGFSPATIKAIVRAQIEARYANQMNQLLGTTLATAYWEPEPTSSLNNPRFYESYSQLNRERMKLLRELLGDDFFATAGRDPTTEQRRQFGDLPKAKIDLLQRIVDDYAEMTSQVRAATQGITLPDDREKFALLERERRADLASILTPAELEEYEMRTSTTAQRLRQTFTFMDASEEEFRAIYRAHQSRADILYPTAAIFNVETSRQRDEVQKQVDEQIRVALGEQRYADYARANNREFQQLSRLALTQNVSPDAIRRAFDVMAPTTQESMRIYEDRSLTPDQKRAALQTLAQNARAQIVATLGPNAGNTYAQTNSWLRPIEAGGAVRLGPDGSPNTFYSPPSTPRPSPTPPRN